VARHPEGLSMLSPYVFRPHLLRRQPPVSQLRFP
jgi:hypothetical protein